MVIVALSVVLLGAAPVAAATQTPYDTNLVKNPGGELDAGGNGLSPTNVHRWDEFAGFRTVKYGSSGFPGSSQGNAINGGKNFFYSGPYDAGLGTCGYAHQNVPITGRANAVDGHHVRIRLAFNFRTKHGDILTLQAFFEDAQHNGIGADPVGFDVLTSSGSTFNHASSETNVPSGTRNLDVYISGADNGDSDCSVFVDNVVVKLSRI